MAVTGTETHRAIDAVWRIESPRLIAGLARIVGDVGLAEDLAQDALVAALEQWPESGVPRNPGAWLMAAAKHRAVDHWRRNQRLDRKHEQLGYEREVEQEAAVSESRGGHRCAGRRRRRRPAATRLHGVPSRALDRGAGRAHPPPPRRADYRGNRACVPRLRTHRRPAHRPGQAHTRRQARAVRGPPWRRACRPALVGARRHLSDLQRRLHGDGWRRLDAARAL